MWFSPGSPVSSSNKTDRHDITEILSKVALNTINQQKGVIRRRKSKKQRKQNGQKKKDKSTMDDLQSNTQKTKIQATRTPLKTKG
jgi:hypothetical protein